VRIVKLLGVFAAVIAMLIAWPVGASAKLPLDSGTINVRVFGAIGDGVADDTKAILRSIAQVDGYSKEHPYQTRIIYFPSGTYRVSDTILRKTPDGLFEPNLILIGESRANTVIRLSDRTLGYGDPAYPKAVIYTSSGLKYTQDPHDGGRDYLGKGEGNEAFGNTVENLTIDVGFGNPGAIGIDFLANNAGAVRNVTITTAGEASVGLSMVRRWPGPALVSDVSIVGFDIGIDIAWTELSMTFDKVRIEGSRLYGMRNTSNIVSFSDLLITTKGGYGLANLSSDGLMVGIGARISGRGYAPLLNSGTVNFKDVSAKEFTTDKSAPVNDHLDGVFQSSQKILSQAKWQLPVLSPPEPEPESAAGTGEWTNVEKFGAVASARVDSTAAFISAFKSDARVIYIPTGQYLVSGPIIVGDNIERIEGMFSTISTGVNRQAMDVDYALFRSSPTRRKPLFIRRLIVEKYGNMSVIIDHYSKAELIMSDIIGLNGARLLYRPEQGGRVFADNTAAGLIEVSGGAGVWLRQLNTEGRGLRIVNHGTPLWILGVKAEQTNTLVQNVAGADTEIVGGLVYRVFGNDEQMPLFVNVNGRLAASYAEEAFRPDAIYSVHLDSRIDDKHTFVRAEDLPRRGRFARMVPSLATD
jgi:hypothetical protein